MEHNVYTLFSCVLGILGIITLFLKGIKYSIFGDILILLFVFMVLLQISPYLAVGAVFAYLLFLSQFLHTLLISGERASKITNLKKIMSIVFVLTVAVLLADKTNIDTIINFSNTFTESTLIREDSIETSDFVYLLFVFLTFILAAGLILLEKEDR